jgi:hypothetical protein
MGPMIAAVAVRRLVTSLIIGGSKILLARMTALPSSACWLHRADHHLAVLAGLAVFLLACGVTGCAM